MIHLNYRDARPIYSQIVDGFRDQILAGILQSGERMPSVRELATELAINPNTIQRAYRELEMQGWIASVPGKGSFICGIPGNHHSRHTQLLETFDKTVDVLLEAGITRQALMARLDKGGNDNA